MQSLQQVIDAFYEHDRQKQAAADSIGMPHTTFYRKLKKAQEEGLKPTKHLSIDMQLQKAKDELRDLRGTMRDMQRDEISAAAIRSHILSIAESSPEPPEWLLEYGELGHAGVPCTIWSDWHWGEVVFKNQVNGVNEFNSKVAHARARNLVKRTIDLCKNHMVGTDYPFFVLNLGGDMISGSLHPELAESDDQTPIESLLDLYGVLIWAIGTLADEFGRLFIPCVSGNHGRTTFKPQFKNKNKTNYDWLLACLLEKHFASDDRVQFHVPEGADAFYTVGKHRFMLTHGDMLGSAGGDGIIGALGPILRGDFKSRNASSQIGLPYDTLIIGHYHQYIPLGQKLIVNGTIKGFDEYAKLKLRAAPERPSQALWFVHKDHGITCHWPVYCDDTTKSKDGPVTVTWPRDV